MDLTLLSLGVLLAAPLFSQTLPQDEAEWFLHLATKDQVVRSMGEPAVVADFGADFRSWQYKIGIVEHEDFSHQVVFRRSTGQLVSVTRNFDPEADADSLFPPALTRVVSDPATANPSFSVRLRRLDGGRVLMAIGTSKPGQRTGQIVWMRESELRVFYPWIAERLAGSGVDSTARSR